MFRHLTQSQLNRPQWDACITQAPNGLIYALSWYLDIVSPNWEALVREEAGCYVAVLPLPVRRKLGLRYVQQPPFTQQLGLFSLVAPTPADWLEIGQLLRRQFRVVTKYAFHTANADLLHGLPLGSAGIVRSTYHLSLRPAYAQLLAGYKPNRRWEVKQARQREFVVEPTTNIDLLVQLFAENVAPKITGLIGENYEYRLLRALYRAAQERGLVTLWQARAASAGVEAIIMLLQFKGQLTYLFSAATPAGKKAGAVVLLLDEVFQTYAGQDLCFDFEAGDVPGLVKFYRSFGAVAAPYLTVAHSRLPWPLRQLRAARAALHRQLRRPRR